jgi:hypothetical protein
VLQLQNSLHFGPLVQVRRSVSSLLDGVTVGRLFVLVVYLFLFLLAFLVFLVLEAHHLLVLEPPLAWGRHFTFELVLGSEVVGSLVGLRDDLKVGVDFALSTRTELVFDDAQQPLIELEQSIDLTLVRLSDFLQLLQFLLVGGLQRFETCILFAQLLHR